MFGDLGDVESASANRPSAELVKRAQSGTDAAGASRERLRVGGHVGLRGGLCSLEGEGVGDALPCSLASQTPKSKEGENLALDLGLPADRQD